MNLLKFFSFSLSVTFVCCLFACEFKKQMPPNEISNLGYDSSRIAIIDLNFEMRWPFDSTYQRTDLSTKEILLLESLIREKIASYNSGIENDRFESFGIDTLRFEYRRQYLPAINGNGEKVVLANYFCESHEWNWKRKFFKVEDGGNCFFRIVINLSTGEISELYINSLARTHTTVGLSASLAV